MNVRPQPEVYLRFDGVDDYVEIPDSRVFSVPTAGGLTIAAWMRPDTLDFPKKEGTGYVHWLGKGDVGQHEWVLRMYSRDNTEGRENRISFYVFNREGHEGIGSYFQDPVRVGQWLHVVGVADRRRTYIYKNGLFRKCDQYRGAGDGTCQTYSEDRWITPRRGTAPVRLGTRDRHSFFKGGLAEVRIWGRPLTPFEIAQLYHANVAPRSGLVAEYLLREGRGTIAHDTANHHDGRIVGATWGRVRRPSPQREPSA